MIDKYDLTYFQKRSQGDLTFELNGRDCLNVFNRFGDRIVELDLSYAAQGIFCDTWYGFVTNEEYREIMSGVYLYYFRNKLCSKKICNTQSLKIGMDRETSEWFVNELLPDLLSAGLKYNAIVMPSDIYARRSMEFFEERLTGDLAMMFPTFDIALLWVQSLR